MSGPTLMVVAGPTASGKTTLCRELASRTGALLIGHDRYYRDVADPRYHNYDHPSSLETALLEAHVQALLAGESVDLPIYEFKTHTRKSESERVFPRPLIIVEGILTLTSQVLRDLAHLRVYVDAPADLRLVRRIRRDGIERGRDVAGILAQYEATVRPMHIRWVESTRAVADLVLDGLATVEVGVERMEAAVGAIP